MQNITGLQLQSWSKHQTGYKTLSQKEIGKHSQVADKLLQEPKKVLKPSDKVIYAAIRLHMNHKTGTAKVSMETLEEKLVYSHKKVCASVQALKKAGYLTYIQLPTKVMTANGIKRTMYNMYSFPKAKGHYECFTPYFIYSQEISNSLKEFLTLMLPVMSYADNCGYDDTELATMIGLSRKTIGLRFEELRELGLASDWYKRGDNVYRDINYKTLMLEGSNNFVQTIIQERDSLIY